ncbi:MAG TPA: hypothetical protein VLM05_01200 [Mycobacteriales bacterium]|nr:hypothetical protein [Mycobacteriales bacterium]
MDPTLLSRLRRWTADGWAVPAAGGGTRADAAAAAVQRLADLGADAEGRPRRPVPRLGDTVLADQLAVMLDDVVRTGDPEALRAAEAEVAALRAALGY